MEIDGVFAGGGIRAMAFVGAIKAVEDRGYHFNRIAGTSAGSILASLLKAGYTSKEIETIFTEINLLKFLDNKNSYIPFMKWLRIYKKLGIYKGEELENWLREKLKEKGISTFGDLPPGSLKIIASDLTKGMLVVLPDDLEKYGLIPERFSVAKAVRMSCSIPYFFEPVKLYDGKGQKHIIVDGAVLSNFPMWLFMDEKSKSIRPVVGFKLNSNKEEIESNQINNAFEMVGSLIETMLKAHDARYISKGHAKNIIFIPVDNVTTTDFNLSSSKKEELIQLGRERTEQYFLTNQINRGYLKSIIGTKRIEL